MSIETHPRDPGKKRIPVTLVIHTFEDVPEEWAAEPIQFYIEENHCLGNYLRRIQEDEAAAAQRMGVQAPCSICEVCSVAVARVGHLPFPPESK